MNSHLVQVRTERLPSVPRRMDLIEFRATCLKCQWTEKAYTDREARERGFQHEFHLNNKVSA